MLVAEKLLILPFCKDTKFVLQKIRIFIVLLLTALSVPLLAQEADSLRVLPRIDSLVWDGEKRDTLFTQPKGSLDRPATLCRFLLFT